MTGVQSCALPISLRQLLLRELRGALPPLDAASPSPRHRSNRGRASGTPGYDFSYRALGGQALWNAPDPAAPDAAAPAAADVAAPVVSAVPAVEGLAWACTQCGLLARIAENGGVFVRDS